MMRIRSYTACLFLLLTACPQVDRVTPTTVHAGDVVDLRDPDQGSLGWAGVVYFGSAPVPSEDVLSWSATDVFVKVPSGLSGSIWVRLEDGNLASNWKEVNLTSDPVTLRILCFGDSNTYRRYPEILQSLDWGVFEPVAVINQGKSAEHVAYAPVRFEEVIRHHNHNQDLDVVVLMEGTNDVFDTHGVELTDMQGALADMLGAVPMEARLLLATVPPLVDSCGDESEPTVQDWNTWLRSLAYEEGIPLVDIHEHFVITPGWETRYFNEADCVHPNGDGQRMMAERIREAIVSLFP